MTGRDAGQEGPGTTAAAATTSKPTAVLSQGFLGGLRQAARAAAPAAAQSLAPRAKLTNPLERESHVFERHVFSKLDSRSLENLNEVFKGMPALTNDILAKTKQAEQAAQQEFVRSAAQLDKDSPIVLTQAQSLIASTAQFPLDVNDEATFGAFKSALSTTLEAVKHRAPPNPAPFLATIHEAIGRVPVSGGSGAKVGDLVAFDVKITAQVLARAPRDPASYVAQRQALAGLAVTHGKDAVASLMKEANHLPRGHRPRAIEVMAELLVKLQPPGNDKSYNNFRTGLAFDPAPAKPAKPSEHAATIAALFEAALDPHGKLAGDDAARALLQPVLTMHGMDLRRMSKLNAMSKAVSTYTAVADL